MPTTFTLQQVLQSIEQACLQRDMWHEMTPANKIINEHYRSGKFEAVETGRGNEKCLIPDVGILKFLYRGQGKEYIPCYPSIKRQILKGNIWAPPSDLDVFIDRMKLVEFRHLLVSHPVVKNFFVKHNFIVDYEGLAQHYGLRTSVIDLTSNIDVALFFATCWYDGDNDTYHYYDDNREHEAILYVFDPLFDNEPSPAHTDEYLNHNIRPIGLQAFPRPGRQSGFSLHLQKDESLKCFLYRFTFTCEDSKRYYNLCINKLKIWDTDDVLIEKARQIKCKSRFSYKIFQEAYSEYKPRGYSKSKLKVALGDVVCTKAKEQEQVVFTEEEKRHIIDRWNNTIGPVVADSIVRRPWYEHVRIDENGVIIGKRNERDYDNLKHVGQIQTTNLISSPNPIQDAEWVNYSATPRQNKGKRQTTEGWRKIPAQLMTVFGKNYLKKEDFLID